jgi:hypothetical protein
MTVDVRYLGTHGRKQWNAQQQINQPNFRYNGLKEAFDAVRNGQESPLLDQIFNGVNLVGSGFGPVGTVFQGVLQTAGMHMRASTQFRSNLANGNYSAVANTLDTLNYNSAFNPTLPPIPAGVNGQVLRHNNFPENFIRTNPQFNTAHMVASINSNNYHSMAATFTLRPTAGINTQSTYTWSKNLGVFGEVGRTYTDPADRHADYAILRDSRTHDFRTNGTFTLPIGPNRRFFSGASGTVARILEDWSMSWIINVNSGEPLSIGAQSMLYANGTADIVGSFDPKAAKVVFPEGANSGNYFLGGELSQVTDPQCATVTTLQNLRNNCTLDAIADASGRILLQTPLPGTRGNLGMNVTEGPGRWRFDANIAKQVRISESKTIQFRIDATNVFNHPEPATPIMDISNANFGLITGVNAKSALRRQFQAQLRLNF